MRELGSLFRWQVIDLRDLDKLWSAWPVLVRSVNPMTEAEVVGTDDFRTNKNVIAGLLEIFICDTKKSETFWC